MLRFADSLYGSVDLPEWIAPFLKLPEFVRLRSVRLSNVDSFQFKDFAGPTRWEHCLAVAWLAQRCGEERDLCERDRVHLTLAALLHDVATPPFAHTAEYVLEGFDHEIQSQGVLSCRPSDDFYPELPVFAAQLPQFRTACDRLAKQLGVDVDADEVARMVVGDGDQGFLIHGSVDLDNADNVTRACRFLGCAVDPTVPPRVAQWLATQKHAPTDLSRVDDSAVQEWVQYRGELYSRFFESWDEEIGRQAFLQHLMRRAINEGLPRRSLIWNTDERLLFDMERISSHGDDVSVPSLQELVQRYRLLEAPLKVAQVEIDSEEDLRVLRLPQCVSWIERSLTTPTFEPFVIVTSARHCRDRVRGSLFPSARGNLFVFKLGVPAKRQQLPQWLQELTPPGQVSVGDVSRAVHQSVNDWTRRRPWSDLTSERKASISESLASLGNWSFRLSRNDSIHAYPGTFVHAIPAGLIGALGLQGDTIVDPFGGTGQTAIESAKLGCRAISADSNSIACLAARAKLTFLSVDSRESLREICAASLVDHSAGTLPDFDLRDKWFHADTFDELGRIRNFIASRPGRVESDFLLATFSSIISSCTGRRGKQHGFFADNTPLQKGIETPPYINAVREFLDRVWKNLNNIESFYSNLERAGKSPEQELRRVSVVQADVQAAEVADYGVDASSSGAVITSPPYLCMADYALGQRLSYYLTAEPGQLESDFAAEIGARRQRSRPDVALREYLAGLRRFAELARGVLRKDGFLATVLGTPKAKAFADVDLVGEFDSILAESGFEPMWHVWRPISWHRNHGYARLQRERVAVHIRK